jgi:hypothetical protein
MDALWNARVAGIEEQSSISAYDLAQVLKIAAPQQGRLAIFDCCFSEAAAQAFGAMGGLDEAVAATVMKDLSPESPPPDVERFCCARAPDGRSQLDRPMQNEHSSREPY